MRTKYVDSSGNNHFSLRSEYFSILQFIIKVFSLDTSGVGFLYFYESLSSRQLFLFVAIVVLAWLIAPIFSSCTTIV